MKTPDCFKDYKIFSKTIELKSAEDFAQYCVCKACPYYEECKEYYYKVNLIGY